MIYHSLMFCLRVFFKKKLIEIMQNCITGKLFETLRTPGWMNMHDMQTGHSSHFLPEKSIMLGCGAHEKVVQWGSVAATQVHVQGLPPGWSFIFSLWVLQFPPTSPNHANKNCSWCERVCKRVCTWYVTMDYQSIQGMFPSLTECSWIH